MGLDMDRILIETAMKRALRGMEKSPERSIRNLIDLGLNFSNGRFQRYFLSTAQEMLRSRSSAYYALLKDTLEHVDQEKLITLGIDIGYNSCTKGAAVIRSIEAERGYNIPWMLSLEFSEEHEAQVPGSYSSLMRQGKALGVYTYLFFTDGDPGAPLPLAAAQPDCACLLFLRSGQVTDDFVAALGRVKNAMAVVRADSGMADACGRLRAARLPFAVCLQYAESDRPAILDGSWLNSILPAHPIFAFLLPEDGCSPETEDAVYGYIRGVREGQRHPVVPMDILRDGLSIDEVISSDGCLVGFSRDGVLHTHLGVHTDAQYNLFQNSLEDILVRIQALR